MQYTESAHFNWQANHVTIHPLSGYGKLRLLLAESILHNLTEFQQIVVLQFLRS